jgi:NAD(P)H-hydrate epimerase
MTAPRRDSTWVAARVVATERPRVAVTTAAEAAAIDQQAMHEGVPSRALMRAAGLAAAAELCRRYPGRLSRGVAVFAGAGNNGGDAWVVAAALGAAGVRVRVTEVGEPRTDDAAAERLRAMPFVLVGRPTGAERLVVDGLLGTGARRVLDGPIAAACDEIAALRANGAVVVALDLPSGLDADAGTADRAVTADLTLAFGTLKRGTLLRRDLAGGIAVLDIGLGLSGRDEARPALVDAPWVRHVLPSIAPAAHKGTRGKVVIVGGARGMTGAAVLAARAALASGAGMVKVLADAEAQAPLAAGVPAALTGAWPATTEAAKAAIEGWAHAAVVGPGLGPKDTRALVARIAHAFGGPMVLDADALTAFAGALSALEDIARGRAVLTPHVGEAARLLATTVDDVRARPFAVAQGLADATGAVVLLKGVPTIVAAPDAAPLLVARGTPALATGGSGDVLAGVLGTLLAQGMSLQPAAAAAAWVHGVAAERAGQAMPVRGVTLEDVLVALPSVWDVDDAAALPPVLAELPAIPA